MTKTCVDHFKLAFAFNVPVIIVITKIDMVSDDQLFQIRMELNDLLKAISDKILLKVDSEEDVALCSRTIQEDICPVFYISNKTGAGLDYFRYFLNLLPTNNQFDAMRKNRNSQQQNEINEADELAEFQVLETMKKLSSSQQ